MMTVFVKRFFILIILLVSIQSLFAIGKMEEQADIAEQVVTAISRSRIKLVPEYYLRGYDPITVFFDRELGPAGGGPLDDPSGLLQMTPPHPGEYRWIDSKTLQFLPTEAWPALMSYNIKAQDLQVNLFTMMIPPSRIEPASGSGNLNPLKNITLSFNHSFAVSDLSNMITFEIKPLPGVGDKDRSWLTGKDFVIKELDRKANDDTIHYLLALNNPIGYGKHITMNIRLSLDENIQGSLARYEFSTKSEFRLVGIGSGYVKYPIATRGSVYSQEQAIDCGTGQSPLFIEFTEYLSSIDIETVKKMVRFEPAVRDLRHEVSGNRLYLYFNVDRNTPYKANIHFQKIISSSNRELAAFGQTSFYFYYKQLSSYLQWKTGQAMVERHGPQFFPMQGRGIDQVDLRIYKLDPLDRNFWPFPASVQVVDEETRPPMPGEEPEYGTQLKKQIRLQGTPPVSEVINLPISKHSSGTTFGLDLKPYLQRISGAEQPGTYLVGYRLLGQTSKRNYVRLLVTDLSLSTIEEEHAINFLITSLKSGQPIAGARVVVEADFDNQWQPVIQGVTNEQGRFRYQHTKMIAQRIKRIYVSYQGDYLVLDPEEAPPHFQNNHWFSSSSSWLSWVNLEPRKDKEKPRLRGFIITERPIYRPDEAVHILGYARQRKEGKILAVEQGSKLKVTVDGPGGKTWTYPVELAGNGYFYVKFQEEDLPTGDYLAQLRDESTRAELDSVWFKKEAYRIPRFEVNISGPDRVPLDKEFELTMTADYYAGGRVVGQEVAWEITQYGYRVRPSAYPGYLFSTDESFTGGASYWSQGSSVSRDVTDENGSSRITINPALDDDISPKRYLVMATVRGADAQTVTASKQVIALPAFMIGLKIDRFLKQTQVIKPEIIVMDYNNELVADKSLQVRLYERQWHSYLTESDFTTGETKYVSDVVDKLIYEKYYVSRKEPLRLELPVERAGVYVVEVLAKDDLGRLQKVHSDLYVAGDTPVSWEKTQANVFETSLDQKSYAQGDEATLLLKSPFQEASALVVVETPRKNKYYWVEIKNGQGLFSLTIEDDMVPRVPIHALLIRGRLEGTGERLRGDEDRGKPIAMANTTWVNVDAVRNRAEVTLKHEQINLPGSTMKMEINLEDYEGQPLDGEVALWLVDRAVLALGEEQPIDPLPAFIDPVEAYLRFRETRNQVVGNLPVTEIPGGDGEGMAAKEMEEELMERTTVRRRFETVPYYNASIKVVKGRAEVDIELPDNLTDFAVRAIGTADFDKFGTARSVVSIRLPVIVQSALPRFVRPGDSFSAGGIGRIVEGAAGAGRVQIQLEGLRLEHEEGDTSLTRSIQWEEKRPKQFYFPLVVPDNIEAEETDTVIVRLAAERLEDGASDAFEVKLPIKRDIEHRRLDTFVQLEAEQGITFPRPDEEIRQGTTVQTLILTHEPAIVRLVGGMNFLVNYAHLCTEQRVSRLYPAIALSGLFDKIGFSNDYKVADEVFADFITYLESTLQPNGLYAFWPGAQGYVNLTAYVVEFLVQARKSGYQFDDKLLNRPITALKEALRSDYSHFVEGFSFRERVEALTALNTAGYYDDNYAQDLLVGALNSDIYTRGKILYSILSSNQDQNATVQKLIASLWQATVFKLKGDEEVFTGLQYRTSAWGGLLLDSQIKSLSAVTRALYRAQPDNSRIRLMVDNIVQRADSDGWGSTNANLWAILALSEVLDLTTVKHKGHSFELSWNGEKTTIKTEGKPVSRFSGYTDSPLSLKYISGDANNLPYAWMVVDYVPATTGNNIKSENQGFVVERELIEYTQGTQVKNRHQTVAGNTIELDMDTIIEEHVRIINAEQRNFVAISVPFAAGFEILNPALATAPPEAAPVGRITRKPSYALYDDDQVTFYYDSLPAGTYDFYFRLRASFAGIFVQPPARAELMYELGVFGRSAGTGVKINKKAD